ncbi:hypothetical protein V5799_032013 [Amblyomma americanum]|uniref:Uncharacterized protein n=1 Tax=Amblyomma americanum TaxID=6943 RepID=A0AAQ4DSD8_AMBAM
MSWCPHDGTPSSTSHVVRTLISTEALAPSESTLPLSSGLMMCDLRGSLSPFHRAEGNPPASAVGPSTTGKPVDDGRISRGCADYSGASFEKAPPRGACLRSRAAGARPAPETRGQNSRRGRRKG